MARRDQCFCPICGKDFGLEESEAIVRDSVLQKKFQQYAPDGYFFKVNFDEEARKKRVPSSYEVVVLRDNNLSSLVSSLCAPYEKISFCLEYRALEVLAYPAIRSECEPSTSYSSVKLQRSSARISVKREPEYRSTGSVEDSVFFRRYFKASALTSLEALQSLLQRILELDKYGFKAHFLDMDGRSFLNSRWSIREIGYLFNWDRRSVLTIWFTLQNVSPLLLQDISPEKSVVHSALPCASREMRPKLLEPSKASTACLDPRKTTGSCKRTVAAKPNSRKKSRLQRKKVSRKGKANSTRIQKAQKHPIQDDPLVVERVHYILEHGHPPPDPSFGSSKLCDSPCSLSSPSASYVSSALNEDERKNTDLSKDHSSLSLRKHPGGVYSLSARTDRCTSSLYRVKHKSLLCTSTTGVTCTRKRSQTLEAVKVIPKKPPDEEVTFRSYAFACRRGKHLAERLRRLLSCGVGFFYIF
ncbi:unnamed protein product [Enterobius vermicularis]|uniref:RAWUL domain-containing protein n=1 Tax=Enterobius vermicularis TaxID=51028 RepID=A0A0N4VA46_ENTVE|nr:unnamed protein product [Enterobius vermicularis]